MVQDIATRSLGQEKLWSLHEDADGGLWFGTSTGLYRLKAGKLTHFTQAEGLTVSIVYAILEDSKENVWLSGPSGVMRLPRSELDAVADGKSLELSPTLYVSSYDMEYATLYGGIQPTGWITRQGDVWFPSNLGAVHIAANNAEPKPPPPIALDQVIADGRILSAAGPIVLKPGNERLEISFVAMRLRSQDAVRYRYRMEGLEPWTEAYTRRTAYYTNLRPGRYTFRVQTFDVNNPHAASETAIIVIQEPHFYRTFWFVTLCVLGLGGAVIAVYRMRVRQIRLRFQAVLEERARLAREMHDTLIQGCVGVSTLLEAALEVGSTEEALTHQLVTYANEQVRTTIDEAREAVWALRHATAGQDATFPLKQIAQQFSREFNLPIDCVVSGTPFPLTEAQVHELRMVAREALSNAIVHGNPSDIIVRVEFEKDSFEIEIRDNGTGFDPALQEASAGKHYGLLGMKERVQSLGGNVNVISSVGQGTTVKVTLPWKEQHSMARSGV